MTAQIHDVFVYQGFDYAVVGIKGGVLFEPQAIGLNPTPASTACWRGYVCRYALQSECLVLDRLDLHLDDPASAPPINGRSPEVAAEPQMFNTSYQDIALRLEYSGGVLVGRDFIHKLYVHMGFHPAWKYKTVHELMFEEGKLVSQADISKEMAAHRASAEGPPQDPRKQPRKDILSWIRSTFDQDYD